MHKYHKSCPKPIWPFYGFSQLYELKCLKTHSYELSCTGITNRVLNSFDHLTACYNSMSWNVRKLITPRVKCKKKTNRVLNLSDRFRAYYNCMSWYVTKLVTPRVLCTHIVKHILSLFDRFKAFLYLFNLKCRNSHDCASSVHKYHKSCSKVIWPFYGLSQLYELKCQKTHNSSS